MSGMNQDRIVVTDGEGNEIEVSAVRVVDEAPTLEGPEFFDALRAAGSGWIVDLLESDDG